MLPGAFLQDENVTFKKESYEIYVKGYKISQNCLAKLVGTRSAPAASFLVVTIIPDSCVYSVYLLLKKSDEIIKKE